MEYRSPHTTMKDKEIALNFVCSMIVPVDSELEKIMVELIDSNVQRMNMQKGKEMLAMYRGKPDVDDEKVGHYETDSSDMKSIQ